MTIMIKIMQFFLYLGAIILLYIGTAKVLTYFPKSASCDKTGNETIFVLASDEYFSHTEIIFKLKKHQKLFFETFPDLLRGNSSGYLSFSYGDRDFMMDKGGFDDLNITLALRGLFINTPGLIKVGHYGSFSHSHAKTISLTSECATALLHNILNSFTKNKSHVVPFADHFHLYYVHYYLAKKAYNLWHTCNTWTGDRLRQSGFRMGYWTPFASNVTSQFN